MKYETIIGLEVHLELATDSKLFCACANRFGAQPNTLTCPVCLGLPGSLPALNRRAVDQALKAAVALNTRIAPCGGFDRKHYFYPDCPKGYQITQWRDPLGRDGFLEIKMGDQWRRVGINRLHLEEDAGKLIHDERSGSLTSVDFNRSGVPLVEIVTEPDIRSPEEAVAFLETLRLLMKSIGVSDCKMQEGSLRCDANISLRQTGCQQFGTKTELKNINSFRYIENALIYEQRRQADLLDQGCLVNAETRRWDEKTGMTVVMRNKEASQDYLYCPEPDLGCMAIGDDWVHEVRRSLPELPRARLERWVNDYHLSEADADLLLQSSRIAELFEECIKQGGDPTVTVNWILGEVFRLLNINRVEPDDMPLQAAHLVEIMETVRQGTVSKTTAKQVLAEVFSSGLAPAEIMRERRLWQISDPTVLDAILEQVIADHPAAAADLLDGEVRAAAFLVGQVMKKTQGKANPQVVHSLIGNRMKPGAANFANGDKQGRTADKESE